MTKVFDRVKQTSTSTGTGDFSITSNVAGFQRFSDVFSVGDQTFYAITQGANFETGRGTYSAVDTLTRDEVFESTNSNQLVDFSAGTKEVFVSYPAKKSVTVDQATALSIALGG
jgi:hypothetical protein